MTRDEPEPETLAQEEEEFAGWLAACDEQFAAGAAVASLDQVGVSEELRPRLEREAAWCQSVRRMWPRAAGFVLDPTTGLVLDPTAGTPGDGPPISEPMPRRFGRFLVRRELGRGAFGVVSQAYDPHLRREVALKVPRAEVQVTPELRTRFRHEAMAAAGLDHPNIVPVYEAGEEGPVCFITSAYCPGTTLAAWLRRRSGPVPCNMAAGLVATLAEAVEHAHGRGVLHRDLKPSNVLLEVPATGEPAADGSELVPRITDFGLAKLLDALPAEDSTANPTVTGVILGTPCYMAPEQAEGRAGAVGPAADIYSLGVILYEVLTGRPPFQEDSALETLVQVRTQDPLPPSRLRPRLPRDLETVCLKCLNKPPQARYPSAQALAEDLRRFLAALPIRARPTPAWERAFKWVRRHPARAAAVAAVASTAIAVAVVIGLANVRLQRERDRAELRRREAVANLRKARDAVDRMLTRVSEVRLKDIPQVEPVQRVLLEDALEFYRDFARQAPDDPEVQLEASQAYRRLGRTYYRLGRSDEAESCFREAFAIQERLTAAFPTVAAYRKELAESHNAQGQLCLGLGRKAEAADAARNALALLENPVPADPNGAGYRLEQAAAHNTLARALEDLGQPRAAEADYRKAIGLLDELAAQFPTVPEHQTRAAVGRNNLAVLLENQGRLGEAETVLRENLQSLERLAAGDPSNYNYPSTLALTLDNLADVWEKSSRKPEAEQALRRSAGLRSGLTKDFPNTPYHLRELGDELARLANLASDRGDLGEARRLQEQVIAHRRSVLALAPRNTGFLNSVSAAHAALIETLIRLGAHQDANTVIAEFVTLSPDSGPQRFGAGTFLARCVPLAAADTRLTDARRTELARTYADRAVELLNEAKKRGYENIEVLKSDHSFDVLRSRADFRQLPAGSVKSPAPRGP